MGRFRQQEIQVGPGLVQKSPELHRHLDLKLQNFKPVSFQVLMVLLFSRTGFEIYKNQSNGFSFEWKSRFYTLTHKHTHT